jgi:hypothetical protein
MFLRLRLAELLRPFSTRMRRHIVMQDLAPAQFHDHEYIKNAEAARWGSIWRAIVAGRPIRVNDG